MGSWERGLAALVKIGAEDLARLSLDRRCGLIFRPISDRKSHAE